MYLFFNKSGVLKEIYKTESERSGSNLYNHIYIYFEGYVLNDVAWIVFKKSDDTLTNEYQIDTKTIKQLPYDPKQDLKFFKYGVEYNFYDYTLKNTDLDINGLVLGTIRLINGTTINALGMFTFNVENSVIKTDANILQSQYDYLLSLIVKNKESTYIGNVQNLDELSAYTSGFYAFTYNGHICLLDAANKTFIDMINLRQYFRKQDAGGTWYWTYNQIVSSGVDDFGNTTTNLETINAEKILASQFIKSPIFMNANNENIETKINLNTNEINNEVSERESADITLQSNIDKKINLTEKGTANGVAPLNADGKIDNSYLKINSNLLYSGEINTSGVCTLNQAFIEKFGINSLTITKNDVNTYDGAYFVVVGGDFVLAQGNAGGSITYNLGDAVVSHGNKGYGKIDNSENVTSVNGKQGAVVLTPSDIGATSIEHFDYYVVQSGHTYTSMTAEEIWALPMKRLLINQYGEIMYVDQGSDLMKKSIYVIGLFKRRQESQNAFLSSTEILNTRKFITPSYYGDMYAGTLEHQILSINWQDQEQDIFALTTTDYGICMVLTEETKTNESSQTILEYSIVANGILYQGIVNKDLNTFTLTQKPAKQAEQSTNGKALLDTDDLGKIIQLDFTGTLSGNVITFALTQQDLTLIENNTYEIDLHLHVSGVISDDATMVLNYNGNTINLSNIINNSGTMMVRDMRQLQKYNSDTGYRWIFQAVYNTANSQLFFGIPSTVVKQDIISLDNETFLDYITLGGLENGQLVVIDKIIAGSNGYLLGHTYKVVYDYQSDTYSTIDINENNIQITETAPVLATLVSGASYTCLNNISSLTLSDISSATEETIIYFIASQDFYISVPDTTIIESEGLQCLSGVAYELHIKHNRAKLIGANDADTREIVYLDINDSTSLYYDSYTLQNVHDCIYIINWSRALYTSQTRGIAFCGSIKNCSFEIHFKNNPNLTDTNQYISLFSDSNRQGGMSFTQLPSSGIIHSNDKYFYPYNANLSIFEADKKPFVSLTTDGTTTTKITRFFSFDSSKDGKALLNATYGYDKVVS